MMMTEQETKDLLRRTRRRLEALDKIISDTLHSDAYRHKESLREQDVYHLCQKRARVEERYDTLQRVLEHEGTQRF